MIVCDRNEWKAMVNACEKMQCSRPMEEVPVHLV